MMAILAAEVTFSAGASLREAVESSEEVRPVVVDCVISLLTKQMDSATYFGWTGFAVLRGNVGLLLGLLVSGENVLQRSPKGTSSASVSASSSSST